MSGSPDSPDCKKESISERKKKMKIKLTIQQSRGPFTSKSGRTFYASNAEIPDEGGDWPTCRVVVMSDHALKVGTSVECILTDYSAQKGEARARV